MLQNANTVFYRRSANTNTNNKTRLRQNYKVMAKTYEWIILGWFILGAITTFFAFTVAGLTALFQSITPNEPIAETIGSYIILTSYFTFYCVGIYGTYKYYQRIKS